MAQQRRFIHSNFYLMKKPFQKRIDYENWTLEQFEEDLRTNPRYEPLLNTIKDDDVEKFIRNYAKDKYELFENFERTKSNYDYRQTQHFNWAEEFFEAILNKKLFNLQCLWRAGQIDLPYVKLTDDFDYFEENVHECPFIEPLTEHDVELAITYIKEQRWWDENEYDDWQDYSTFKTHVLREETEDDYEPRYGRDYPYIYDYFDTYQNTGHLIKLPDVRSERERYYYKIGIHERIRERNQQRIERGEPEPNTEGPFVYKSSHNYLFDPQRREIVEDYEDDQIKEAYMMKDTQYDSNRNTSDEVKEAIDFLSNAIGSVPMLADDNWQTALFRSVRHYKNCKIAEHLPYIYDTYLMAFDDDDPKEAVAKRVAAYDPTELEKKRFDSNNGWMVLEGRRLLGEPENFDFWDEV